MVAVPAQDHGPANVGPGTKLGPYEIISPLGAGGMGEVYRARDTRLGRSVAIKVLPQRLSHMPDLRQRLNHEARAISKLSHPNICALYDIGHHEGTHFLVLEYLEGKTLRQILNSGTLPVRRIIHIAVQVAEGLANAHEGGIIHRDLKPENLMVCMEIVKILDFGLAKKLGVESEGDAITDTIESAQMLPEAIVGTSEYMSPEQASGHALDFRSDQFSFGTVLYEMATRKRPFRKATVPQTLSAIIQEEPRAIGSLNPEIPPPFCWVVERCIAKEPEKRYFSTRDLVRDLVAIRDRLTDLQPLRFENRPSNLPASNALLLGREKELTAVTQLVRRREVRLVTVTGPGGIGKSHFATEVAREIADNFSFGVYFVPLAAVTDPSLIPSVIAQTVGIRESGGYSPLESLKDYLRSCAGPMLLLIDNFEHLLAAAPLFSELLAVAAGLKILVTSRAALRVQDENEFPLPPLALPDRKAFHSVETLSQFPAIALFVQRALAVKPGFALTDENASAVAEICTRLDGLPLAIQLAAARIKLLSPSAIRSRLAHRLQLLTSGARDLPARQQTLRQAIDWSYDLLSEPEQKLFRRLSMFAAGFTLEAAEAVCDTNQDLGQDLLDGMASMVDKSLVRQLDQGDQEPRFFMLETIREYGLEKLGASGEEAPTRRAHAAYCLVLAEEAAAENVDREVNRWLDIFETEHDNFRMALEWLTETHSAEWGLRLGAALFRFWEVREYLAEGLENLGKLLGLEQARTQTNARMRALFAAGVLASDQRDYSASEKLFKESLEIARLLQDKQSMAISLNALAVSARDNGDLASAISLFEESLLLWKELGDRLAAARAVSNLGTVLESQGNYADARIRYEECLSIFQELGDSTSAAWVLNHQGDLLRDEGDLPAARMLYEQSLAKFRELSDRWGIAGSLADLGNLAGEQGDFATSDALYRESLILFQDLGHKRGVARLLESFACSAAEQAQPERALKFAGVAAALRQTIGAPLTSTEQTRLEQSLSAARRKLTTTHSKTAWLEGWVMPVEIAINDLLRPTSVSGSVELQESSRVC